MRMQQGSTVPAKLPVNMHQFATWLDDYVTKLTVEDEAGAYIEPRRAMSHQHSHAVSKPL